DAGLPGAPCLPAALRSATAPARNRSSRPSTPPNLLRTCLRCRQQESRALPGILVPCAAAGTTGALLPAPRRSEPPERGRCLGPLREPDPPERGRCLGLCGRRSHPRAGVGAPAENFECLAFRPACSTVDGLGDGSHPLRSVFFSD